MKEYPLISVIVACYNHERYLVETLESIATQNYPQKQLVIIDDGSKDNSASLIQEWVNLNSSRFNDIKFVSRPNKGLSSTLNEALTIAEGEYISFLASDDVLIQGSLMDRYNFLKLHPNKLVVIGDANVIDSNSNLMFESAIEELYHGNKDNYKNDELLKYSVINEWSVPGPVMLAHKDLYKIIGPYPEDLFAEDLNFYLNAIGRNLLIFIDKPVALYRVHDSNTCRTPAFSKKIGLTILKSYYRNRGLFKGEYRSMINKKIMNSAKNYIRYVIGK